MNPQTLRIVGSKFPALLQGVLESALVADLRSKHRMNFHLPELVNDAKASLAEQKLPLTPKNLRTAAADIASARETLLADTVGTTEQYWNPITNILVERPKPDPRAYFIR